MMGSSWMECKAEIIAILRNLLHTTHHIGQIDLLATVLKNQEGEE